MMKTDQPKPVNTQIHVELSDKMDKPSVTTDREEDWTRPPIYDEKGREVDEDDFLLSPLERLYRKGRRLEAEGKL